MSGPTSDDGVPPHEGRRRLSTARLVLVPQTRAAAAAVLAGEDAGLALAEGYPHADTRDALRMFVENASSDDDGGWWVTLDDRVIGDCGTHGPPDGEGRLEIGYGLAAPFRGRGYGTEAVAAMCAELERQDGVRALVADVEVGNLPSRRLLERLGFALDGEADGHWQLSRPVPPPG